MMNAMKRARGIEADTITETLRQILVMLYCV